MHENVDVIWWITAVELPVISGLFWMITRHRRDAEQALEAVRQRADNAQSQVREALANYKVEVARSYAGLDTLKTVEQRLTDHLLRIEAKLEFSCGMLAEGGL
ncbi:MAG: hypothetical protein WCO00_09235 [Rhodospirillaceae bacterium]